MQISRNKSFYITKESNPHTGLGQQHGRRFIVLYTSVTSVAVVVLFHPWFKFHFSLFWGMVLYDKEFKSRRDFLETIYWTTYPSQETIFGSGIVRVLGNPTVLVTIHFWPIPFCNWFKLNLKPLTLASRFSYHIRDPYYIWHQFHIIFGTL